MKNMIDKIKNGQINILNEMMDYIVDEVYYAALKQINPIWNEESESMVMELTFDRGTRSYNITYDWMGTILSYSEKMPKHMIIDIHNGICAGYLKGIMDEMKETSK